MTGEWMLLSLGILVIAQVCLLTYARYRASAGDGQSQEWVAEEPVECPECGIENQPEYKNCRQCVGGLPTRVSFARTTSGPGDWRVR
jgi:hypothetical protein